MNAATHGLKSTIKQLLPDDLWFNAATRWRMQVQDRTWATEPAAAASRERLLAWRDQYAGERCFILGNGPSLGAMNLAPLRHEYTFGLNRAYLLFERLGFATSWLVTVNDLVVEQCAADLDGLDVPTFTTWRNRDHVTFDDHYVFLRTAEERRGLSFSQRPDRWIFQGSTVTFVAMQLAFWFGFHEVVLIGVDHSFTTKGTPHTEVVSGAGDPDHFDPNYFGPGFRWQLPDLDTSELSYELARNVFAADGREIVDATVDGKLDVFRKVSYESLVR